MENKNFVRSDLELCPKEENAVDIIVNMAEDGIGETVLSDDEYNAGVVRNKEGMESTIQGRNNCEKIDIDNKIDNDDCEDDDPDNCFTRGIEKIQTAIYGFVNKYNRKLKIGLKLVLLLLYAAYFTYAIYNDLDGAIALIAMTGFVVFCFAYACVRDNFGGRIYDVTCLPISKFADKHWNVVRWLAGLAVVALVVAWIIVDTSKHPENMMSFVGLITVIVFCFVFSKHPTKVRWRPVVWGLVLQFCLALVILRTKWGFESFRFIGIQVTIFLDYVEAGSEFVFGELWYNHYLLFKLLPIIILMGSIISCLYYLGLVQICIGKLAWLLQSTMHTSASESLNAAANVFLSMNEAPLLVAPYINTMTKSELHAVATGGYATIAGSVMGAAIGFGLSPSYVITASAMSAPAALAVAKLFYPETEKSHNTEVKPVIIDKGKCSNILDALAAGAMDAVPVVTNVITSFIVFLSLLEFSNAVLSWAGGMVGFPQLSFELICAWVFMPFAYLMGVDWDDCFVVAELIGMKIFTSVTVSYQKLAIILENRELGLEPTISARSELIVTYALCGFSHLTGVGMTLATLSGIAPDRKADISSIVVRGMIAGNIANFLTAIIAGILYEGDVATAAAVANSTMSSIIMNTTASFGNVTVGSLSPENVTATTLGTLVLENVTDALL